ncbi:MAG: tyrosyl-tRNA synthetase, tyrosyl-tRNA synthetase [Candidatus Parcubacteria bacterium]|jgi:tyrosyl-tRNA synthetase
MATIRKPKINTDEARIDELLSRGVYEAIVREDLKKKLQSGQRLRIKLGIDPTSPNLHLGRAVSLLKLRDFEELGHQVVLIVGDFTGVIGDTSDKESERPMLDAKVIAQNKKTYFAQVGKLIDTEKAELHYNSKWLKPLKYADIGTHADCFSVADFIARENIAKRLRAGKRVSLREVLYPLMQGYDSVAVRADVELGGIDQKFNLLAGRSLQERFGQVPQNIVMSPLINGLDGRKMSSSWGNTINLTTEPNDMYGKVMSMHDAALIEYFTLCTRVPLREVAEISAGLERGENPKDAKMRLAREIVTLYHTEKAARGAEDAFVATFTHGKVPDNIPEIAVHDDLPAAIVAAQIVGSKGEVARLLKAGAVRNATTGEKLITLRISVSEPTVIRIGKRAFVRIVPKRK